MKIKSHLNAFLLTMVAGGFTASYGQDALAIVKKMDEVMYAPKDMSGTHTITLVDKNGKEETREANILQKGTDKRIMRFTSPASQAGIAVLALPNDVMYMYLPAFGKERRISSSVKNQNFAGTDFSYDDMEPKPYAEKYNVSLKGEEGENYIVEMIPKTRSEYSRLIVHINKNEYYPVVMEYYDQGNNKTKEARYKFKKIGKYWGSEEVVMTDLKKDHKTIMHMSNIQYDTGLTDDAFTIRSLKQ